MVQLRPFRAVRYDPEALGTSLDSLIAPPYDVIDDELREKLAAEPHNIVHLTLPCGAQRYAQASRRLHRWVNEGAIIRDKRPGFYILDEEFASPRGRLHRRCLLGLLHLEEFAAQEVRPHEEIFRGPMEDRLALLRATEANLEPIFCLYDDPRGEASDLLDRAQDNGEPLSEAEDFEGGFHRLSRITKETDLRALEQRLRGRPALIADGHHRYSAALEYAQARQRSGRRAGTPGDPSGFILSAFVSLQDPGLVILPTHRRLRGIPAERLRSLESRLRKRFDLEPFETLDALQREVERGRPGEVGLWVVAKRQGWKLRPRALPAADPVSRLSVSVLEREVLPSVLGPKGELEVSYVHGGVGAALLGPQDRRAQLIGLVRPPSSAEVEAVAAAGLRMPRKSTYFHPKVWSGFALYVFRDQ